MKTATVIPSALRAVAVMVFSVSVLTSCSGSPAEEPFLNPKPDIELCRADPAFQKLRFEGWEGTGAQIDVRFLPHATSPCPGRRFPFVDAGSTPPLRWIQVVEANVPIPADFRGNPTWQLVPQDEPWVFLDMVDKLRDSGEPFLNMGRDGRFWDNPTWPNSPDAGQKDGVRKWQTRSYAVVATDHTVRAVVGFSWGWTWAVGARGPDAIAPAPVARATWVTDAERLATALPRWTFQ